MEVLKKNLEDLFKKEQNKKNVLEFEHETQFFIFRQKRSLQLDRLSIFNFYKLLYIQENMMQAMLVFLNPKERGFKGGKRQKYCIP